MPDDEYDIWDDRCTKDEDHNSINLIYSVPRIKNSRFMYALYWLVCTIKSNAIFQGLLFPREKVILCISSQESLLLFIMLIMNTFFMLAHWQSVARRICSIDTSLFMFASLLRQILGFFSIIRFYIAPYFYCLLYEITIDFTELSAGVKQGQVRHPFRHQPELLYIRFLL